MIATPHPAAAALLAEFDAGSISRGQRYQRQGQVLDFTAEALPDDAIELEGKVSGGAARPYVVSVSLVMTPAPAVLLSSCSCFLGGDCKHAVALVLEWLAQGGAGPAPAPGRDEQQGLAWLRQLEAPQRPRPGPPGRLRYVVARGLDRRKAVLSVYKERLLKSGDYGKPDEFRKFIDATHVEPRPLYVDDADLPILGQLELRQYSGAGATLVCDQDGYLLSLLAATGRCHCAELDGPVLRPGPPRAVQLDWQLQDGGWRLHLAGLGAEGVAVLAEPPHYLDLGTGEFGPVQVTAPSHLLRPLLEGPALSPETLALIQPRLAPLLDPLGVAPPPVASVAQSKGGKPKPCLRLHLLELGTGRRLKTYGVASLSFDYDGQRVAAETPGEWLHRDGITLLRDTVAEMAAVRELRQSLQPLQQLIQRQYLYHKDSTLGQYLPRDQDQWPELLAGLIGRLEREGWRVSLDPNFPWQRVEAEDWYGQLAEQGDWFGVELGVEVDGERLNLLPLLVEAIEAMSTTELRRLEAAPEATVDLLHGRKWLRLPASRLLPLIALLNNWTGGRQDQGRLRLPRLDAARLLQEVAATTWKAPPALIELGRQLDDFDGIEAVPLPEGFQATLRPYQQAGYNWLAFLRRQGLGGVLADDMGLGKTVQTLAFLAHEKAAGRLHRPALVVCPTSLLANWRTEAARFAPMLRLLTWHGGDRHQQPPQPGQFDVILTSYALLGRDQAHWREQRFAVALFDEAQNLKNPRSQMFGAARQLRADCRLALTGTPMENHLGELWAIFDLVMPGYLGSAEEFKRYYRNPIEKEGDDTRRRELVRRIKPLLVRRSKDQVATELPPKTVIVRPVALEGAQRDLYETVRSSMDSKLQEVLARKGLARSSIEILDALLKLRQVCCDPRLLKLEAARQITASAKLDLLFTLLPEQIAEGRRILLFSQFTSMLGLIEQRLAVEQIPYVKLTGQTRDREEPVRAFQAGEVPLFLISLKAGGVGLNLTAADTVIHYDPWWNPAVEDQATDRAYRIGQDKPVFVYKLIAEGTVEERIIALQQRKAALAGGVYGDTEGFSGQLGADDVQALLQPLQ